MAESGAGLEAELRRGLLHDEEEPAQRKRTSSMGAVERLVLSPWEKWAAHGRFPYKLTLHVALVLLTFAQMQLYDAQNAAYMRASHRNWYACCVLNDRRLTVRLSDAIGRRAFFFLPPAADIGVVPRFQRDFYTINRTMTAVHYLRDSYFSIGNASVANYEYLRTSAGEIQPLTLTVTRVLPHGELETQEYLVSRDDDTAIVKKKVEGFTTSLPMKTTSMKTARDVMTGSHLSRGLISRLHSSSSFLTASLLLLWSCLVGYLEHNRHIYSIVLTLKWGTPRVLQFLLGVSPIFFGYALFGTIYFGNKIEEFGTLSASMITLFSLMNGDIIMDTFDAMELHNFIVSGKVYLYSFISLFMYVVLNIFIAIVEEAFFATQSTRRRLNDLLADPRVSRANAAKESDISAEMMRVLLQLMDSD
uniref:Polycystin cation channel PKD1/PKD2 domain-containing protein n=1 Tax=Phytophthora ramorum TaxID=164328 RepID=H3GK24_PHYRM